ncbi:predicted protein [Aspergillus terreus NIH2624]|uniref:Uncharacterized protein n=1 Tax=Aspergillus terreus (strain NIH 2624 / FGSC A1156) TaxID=341663 RepID=Q0CUW7_ASPTN|nr:uncharacterized protein ATEG_02517 [Aspergillus terreus NIH2624]EAU37479.1 predicted protein [Aspergillus terreus NIH2624]
MSNHCLLQPGILISLSRYYEKPVLDIEDAGLSASAADGSEEATSGSPACAEVNHISLDWDGFFPWSAHPVCADCGTLYDFRYISRRKRAAWAVSKELRAQFKGRWTPPG